MHNSETRDERRAGSGRRARWCGGRGRIRSYGEEADREREDADEEEGEGAQHAPAGVAEAAAAGRGRGGVGLRHCGRVVAVGLGVWGGDGGRRRSEDLAKSRSLRQSTTKALPVQCWDFRG